MKPLSSFHLLSSLLMIGLAFYLTLFLLIQFSCPSFTYHIDPVLHFDDYLPFILFRPKPVDLPSIYWYFFALDWHSFWIFFY